MRPHVAALVALLLPCAAIAQTDPTAALVGGADVFAHGLAEAAVAGPSVFVTVTGHAPRTQRPSVDFGLTIATSASTAEAAQGSLRRGIESTLAEARKMGFDAAVQSQRLELTNPATMPPPLRIPAVPTVGRAAPPPGQGADTSASTASRVRGVAEIVLHGADPAREAALLDALTAAGVQFTVNTTFNRSILPFAVPGASPELEDSAWDEALRNAMTEAHREAEIAASAAKASVGEARQIVVLSRSADARRLSATVAVRYALSPH